MSKTDNIQEHLADIDFRTHEERRKAWKEALLGWHKQLSKDCRANPNDERLAGQMTMLSSVLWTLLSTKEYKALVKGHVFIDKDGFTPGQKRLYQSMQAFGGSKYCDKTEPTKLVISYLKRMNSQKNYYVAGLVEAHQDLAYKIAVNLVADAEPQP